MPRLRKQETAPPSTSGRPLFEINPGVRLIAAIKQAFGGHFTPTDTAWWRFECELKEISRTNKPTGHDAFCRSYFTMTADDVIAFLVEHGLVERPKGKRGRPKREVDGLGVDEYLVVLAMRDRSVMQLSPRQLEAHTGRKFSASTYRSSKTFELWQQTRIEEAMHAASVASDSIEAAGLTVTSKGKKTVSCGERMTAKERELNRQADAWIAEHDTGEQSRL